MIAALLFALQSQTDQRIQNYNAWLDTPGGELGFGLELRNEGAQVWSAFLINGEERIAVPKVAFDGQELLLDMPHYDSRIRARVVEQLHKPMPQPDGTVQDWLYLSGGKALEGEWEKRRSETEIARVPFKAVQSMPSPSLCSWGAVGYDAFGGRWSVSFAADEKPAVAVLQTGSSFRDLRGTFLTAAGDYRYLCGLQTEDQIELSCFDGAHAFLFKAKLQPDGTLAGDFYSGNWSHETWTAKRDDNAHLDDPFAQTHWNGKTKLADLRFPDLGGKLTSLGDAKLAGKGYLLVVFGSWCPNCNDEAQFLAELDAKYRDQGLRILGLAFELTGERERDANQVRIFAERHELTFPMFLCGTNDKDEATKALDLVDQVRAFPTTIFVGADGLVRAIHSGYAGPATGDEHVKLRADFERRIAELLGTTVR